MAVTVVRLSRSRNAAREPVVRLGMRLLDEYLEFLGGRCRPNTVLAVAYDLKVFFRVVGKPLRRVRSGCPGRPAVSSLEAGLGGAAGRSGARSGSITGQRWSLADSAVADPFPIRRGSGEWWLDGFDGDGGAVGGDLGHDVADLVAVEPHRDDRVSTPGPGLAPHALPAWLRLSVSSLVYPAASPPASVRSCAPMLLKALRARTISPNTSPWTWVIR